MLDELPSPSDKQSSPEQAVVDPGLPVVAGGPDGEIVSVFEPDSVCTTLPTPRDRHTNPEQAGVGPVLLEKLVGNKAKEIDDEIPAVRAVLDEAPSPSERQSNPAHEEEGPTVPGTLPDEVAVGYWDGEVVTNVDKAVGTDPEAELKPNDRLIEALTQSRSEHPKGRVVGVGLTAVEIPTVGKDVIKEPGIILVLERDFNETLTHRISEQPKGKLVGVTDEDVLEPEPAEIGVTDTPRQTRSVHPVVVAPELVASDDGVGKRFVDMRLKGRLKGELEKSTNELLPDVNWPDVTSEDD
ncbi:MAG: hypothetical protein Q9186_002041 [Xanthomendoza sp. 1 TL-2023]